MGSPVRVTRLRHLPALDGLRAVAVVAVILYHGGVSWLPGGFLGVDLFFVLSGFLITTLLVREREEIGRIDLRRFWIRRFRRLIPALLLVLLAVAAYAHFAAAPATRQALRWDGLASLGYVANWRFVFTKQSYFASFAAPSPLKHMWSLAVEEQWYLFWPLLFGGLMTWCRGRISAVLGVVIAMAFGSALVMRLVLPAVGDPSRAYYGTDTRAQTLLIGAALALAMHRRPIRSERGRALVQVGGLVGLVVVAAMFLAVHDTDSWMYRNGGFALLAVAGALTILAASHPTAGLAKRLLRPAPLRFVGRISYGLYLWHWPVNVYVSPDRFGLQGLGLFTCRVALTFAVALLSYHLLEIPIRTGGLRSFKPKLTTAFSGLVTACLLVVSTTGAPSALATADGGVDASRHGRRAVIVPRTMPSTSAPTSTTAVTSAGAPATTGAEATGPPPAPPGRELRVAVVGDSVGWSMVMGAPKVQGLRVDLDAELGCGVLPGKAFMGKRLYIGADCSAWQDRWRSAAAFHPDLALITVGAWEVYDHLVDGKRVRVGSRAYRRFLLDSLEQGLQILNDQGNPRVGLFNVPCYKEIDPVLGGTSSARNDPRRRAWLNDVLHTFVRQHRQQVVMVDLASFVCPGGRFIDKAGGIPLRPDGVHFTERSNPLLWQWLAPQVIDLARRPVLEAKP